MKSGRADARSHQTSERAISRSLEVIAREVIACQRCPELRAYCQDVAKTKRRAFSECEYWGKPVPGFGEAAARIMIVGLAPAAHGANRTGRMFTGDRSGDFLYAALHRAGLANQPESVSRDDGLRLRDVYITAPLRCAPPANKPSPKQLSRCMGFMHKEIAIIRPKVLICLGAISWKATLDVLKQMDYTTPLPVPRFAHGCETVIEDFTILGCYHVSQQNTFTGKLTPGMIDRVLNRALRIVTVQSKG